MLAAAAAAGHTLLSSVNGEAAFDQRWPRSLEILDESTNPAQQPTAKERGLKHPFFTQAKNHPEVIAHRGGNGQWPGETMYALQQAVNLKVDILEMDVHSTSDGKLVLMHNNTVDETTNGKGCVKNLTWSKLKELDAGHEWSADCGKTFPFRGLGIKVPLLEEVFNAFPTMRMNIEIKQSDPSIVEPFCKMIWDHHMEDKVLVASFKNSVLEEFRSLLPEAATSASTCELLGLVPKDNPLKDFRSLLSAACKSVEPIKVSKCDLKNSTAQTAPSPSASRKPDAIQIPGLLDKLPLIKNKFKGFVETAHKEFNLQVHAWTINEPEDMRKIVAAGVDGIITDYPGPLLELLGRTRKA